MKLKNKTNIPVAKGDKGHRTFIREKDILIYILHRRYKDKGHCDATSLNTFLRDSRFKDVSQE